MSADRSGIEAVLGGMLGLLARNARGLVPFAERYAGELCLDFLGKLERGEGEPIGFTWPNDGPKHLSGLNWEGVESQLRAIAPITGLFAVVPQMLMGIRGEKGDCYLRMMDIQRRRHTGVFQTIAVINGVAWEPSD